MGNRIAIRITGTIAFALQWHRHSCLCAFVAAQSTRPWLPHHLAIASHPHPTHEKIDAIYLSPDAFARRTDEASIADQMGDVFAAAGFPRPIPADNDRIGGWMLMYQMLDANEWLLTDNCIELIRTIPNAGRVMARIEDIEKMEGDDPADAARYGLKSATPPAPPIPSSISPTSTRGRPRPQRRSHSPRHPSPQSPTRRAPPHKLRATPPPLAFQWHRHSCLCAFAAPQSFRSWLQHYIATDERQRTG